MVQMNFYGDTRLENKELAIFLIFGHILDKGDHYLKKSLVFSLKRIFKLLNFIELLLNKCQLKINKIVFIIYH